MRRRENILSYHGPARDARPEPTLPLLLCIPPMLWLMLIPLLALAGINADRGFGVVLVSSYVVAVCACIAVWTCVGLAKRWYVVTCLTLNGMALALVALVLLIAAAMRMRG